MALFIIYNKPIYLITFFSLFLAEYVFLMYYAIKVYSFKDNNYHKLQINYEDLSVLSKTLIWVKICQLNAFLRIYFILYRKKINTKSIAMSVIIAVLGVPYKFLKLVHKYIKNKNTFRNWLEIEYTNMYQKCKNLKIEALNNNFYLNCYNLKKIMGTTKFLNKEITQQQQFDLIINLKKELKIWRRFEEKDNKDIKLSLSMLRKEEKFISKEPHYTYNEKSNSIHPTSNTSFKLENNQKKDIAMPSTTKPNSMNPGTIITKDIKVEKSEKFIWGKEKEIMWLKGNNRDIFDVTKKESVFMHNKKEAIKDIFRKSANIYLKDTDTILKNIEIGNYDYILEELGEHEIMYEIEKTMKEWENPHY